MTDRALQAADELAQVGINASVLHVSTLKPIDRAAILDVAHRTPKVVTLENHTIVGGLASAVSEVCGSVPYLTDKYGLSLRHVISAAQELAEI